MEFKSDFNLSMHGNYSTTTNLTLRNGTNYRLKSNNETYYVAALLLSWLNAFLIITLNSAVIVTIFRYKKRSRLYFLLMNLAIADLLTGIVDAVPHSIERSIGLPYHQMVWVFGEAMCKIQRTAANMPMTASNYILAATSLDRAMVIYKPMMSFKRGHILQKVIIASCWIFSFLVSSPYLHFMTIKPLRLADEWYYCSIDWGEYDALKMWKIMVIVMFIYVFAIPFIVIVVSYAILLVSIYRRTMTPPSSLKNQAPITGAQVFNRGLPKSKVKSVKLTCGIILGFFISWMVFFVVIFMNTFGNFQHQFVMIAITFYFWNSVANPILFFIYHRRQPRRPAASMYSSDTGRNTCSSEVRFSLNAKGSTSFTSISTKCVSPEGKC